MKQKRKQEIKFNFIGKIIVNNIIRGILIYIIFKFGTNTIVEIFTSVQEQNKALEIALILVPILIIMETMIELGKQVFNKRKER